MKKVSTKLQSLVNRIQTIQEQLDELRSELEQKQYALENQDGLSYQDQRKYDSITEDVQYLDDVYLALDNAISDIEDYIE